MEDRRICSLLPELSRRRDLLSDRHLGPDGPDIQFRGLQVWIGMKPVVQTVEVPTDVGPDEVTPAGYEIRLVTFSIGVIDSSLWRRVRALGFVVEYDEEEGPEVQVIGVAPETSLIRRGEGDATCEFTLNPLGVLSSVVAATTGSVPLPLDGSSALHFRRSYKFEVWTDAVQAIGVGDRRTEWLFSRIDRPIVGTQLVSQAILVPEYCNPLRARLSSYAVVRGDLLMPVRLPSAPFEVSIEV